MKETKTRVRKTVDMSPEAIDRRLRDLGQLYELGIQISSARWLGTLKDLKQGSATTGSVPATQAEEGS